MIDFLAAALLLINSSDPGPTPDKAEISQYRVKIWIARFDQTHAQTTFSCNRKQACSIAVENDYEVRIRYVDGLYRLRVFGYREPPNTPQCCVLRGGLEEIPLDTIEKTSTETLYFEDGDGLQFTRPREYGKIYIRFEGVNL